jgi:hypothetical protein
MAGRAMGGGIAIRLSPTRNVRGNDCRTASRTSDPRRPRVIKRAEVGAKRVRMFAGRSSVAVGLSQSTDRHRFGSAQTEGEATRRDMLGTSLGRRSRNVHPDQHLP